MCLKIKLYQKYYKKQREAILNDSNRKELFKALFDLYANAMPIALKKEDGTIICSYSDEVEQLAEKIREEIRLRDNQVFAANLQYWLITYLYNHKTQINTTIMITINEAKQIREQFGFTHIVIFGIDKELN